MANAPSEDIKDLLVTAGVGTFAAQTGWGIYIGAEPDNDSTPDTVITVYDDGGDAPVPNWLLDFPAVQVRVRGPRQDYVAGYTKAQDIKNALLGLPSQTVNGTFYVGIWQTSDIIPLGFDQQTRPLFVTNWRVAREPASGTYRDSL